MSKIDICFLTDDGYVVQTCVAMTSILKNKNDNSIVNIYVLCYNVSLDNIEKMKKLETINFNVNIVKLSPNEEYFKYSIKDIPATPTAMYKFSIPHILSNLEKVIYLDGDIIVNKDLKDLYNINLGDNYVAAIKETGGLSRTLFRLFIHQNIFYFNSGVMVMNLKKMRNDNITELLVDYRKNGYNELMDQDSLNYVLKEKVIELPFKYNTQLMITNINRNISEIKQFYNLDKNVKNIEDILSEAYIIHFSGKRKPWKHYDGYGHDKWIYFYYQSPLQKEELIRSSFSSAKQKLSLFSFIEREKKNYRRYLFMKKFKKDK